MIPIQLPREQKDAIKDQIRAYFETERSESIGDLAAEQLLDFMLKELAPYLYNKGVEDAQRLVSERFGSIDDELYALRRPLNRSS